MDRLETWEILAVEVEQIECLQVASGASCRRWSASKTATPSAPQTTTSPSKVNDRSRSLAAPAAIAG